MSKQLFIVYDGRADVITGTDDAAVMVTEDTEAKALKWDRGCHVWRYDVAEGNELINEHYIGPTLGRRASERSK